MRFDDAFLDELRSRLRPSDVIGRTVKLRRQGREFVGLSPFSKERTPSFFVNDDKGRFFDFSSGKNGDLISFLQETERLSFVEAVERLAAEAGMALPAPDPRAAESEKKLTSLADWLEMAAAWFEAELRRPAGREARAYLERRGLPEADWKRFRLGYAPGGRTALKDYLVAKGAQPASLVEAGLLISPEDGGAPYDRFRDRVMFPIESARGQIVSFGGRALDPQAKAKYLNGPESPIFHKGRLLYGLPEARRLLQAGGERAALVVVEGYTDVIACQRSGVAAVASMGTALTEEQMEVLWRLHPEPTLCFDSDAAGQRAANRAIDRALPLLQPRKSFQFASISEGKDPDDLLRESGPERLKQTLAITLPLVLKLFLREHSADALDTPEKRVGLKVRLRQAAGLIVDPDLRKQYQRDLDNYYWEAFPRKKFIPGWGKKDWVDETFIRWRDAPERLRARARPLNASMAVAAMKRPEWLLEYVEEFQVFGFCDAQLDDLTAPIMKALTRNKLSHDVVDFLIEEAGAEPTRDKAFRIAHEVAALPFLLDSTPVSEARRMFKHAMEALIEIAHIDRELKQSGVGLERPGYLHARGALNERRRFLRKALSDLSVWEDAMPQRMSRYDFEYA